MSISEMPVFTAHNVRLDNGQETKPDESNTVDQFPWFVSTGKLIDTVFPGSKKGVSVVDLGCLEGGYTAEFARMGMDSLGIEVRETNFACCEYVREHTDLPNLRFAKDTVLNIEKYGEFDISFCCGLLYHLDQPRAFLEKLAKQTRKLLILQTHVSLAEDGKREFPLSENTTNEGLPGRWYGEFSPQTSAEQLEQLRWASWENNKSFWVRREYLLELIHKIGFDLVFEQFDSLAPNIAASLEASKTMSQRGTFIGIKS